MEPLLVPTWEQRQLLRNFREYAGGGAWRVSCIDAYFRRAVLHLLLAVKRGDMPAYQEKGRLELPARFVFQEMEQKERKLLFASREKLEAQMVLASFACASGTRHESGFGPFGLPGNQFSLPQQRMRCSGS
jgi:hypothetical protein